MPVVMAATWSSHRLALMGELHTRCEIRQYFDARFSLRTINCQQASESLAKSHAGVESTIHPALTSTYHTRESFRCQDILNRHGWEALSHPL